VRAPNRAALASGGKRAKIVKKNHGKIQIVRRRLLQLSAADSTSDQSSKFKELDIDSCSALTLLKDMKWGFTEMLPNAHYNYVLGIFVTMSIFGVSCERSFSN